MLIKNQNQTDFVKTRFLLAGFYCGQDIHVMVNLVMQMPTTDMSKMDKSDTTIFTLDLTNT